FGEIPLSARDQPNKGGRLCNARHASTNVLRLAPFVRLVRLPLFRIGIAVGDRLEREWPGEVVLIKISLDSAEGISPFTLEAILSKCLLLTSHDGRAWRVLWHIRRRVGRLIWQGEGVRQGGCDDDNEGRSERTKSPL